MFLLRVIFIFFALGGIAAFLAFSISPVLFWFNHGYWSLADPPKMIILGSCFLALHAAVGFGGLLYLHWTEPDEQVDIADAPIDRPWLSKTYWQQAEIAAKPVITLKLTRFVSHYFAAISLFPLFAIYESLKLLDYSAMMGLIFPAFALFLHLRYQSLLEHRYRYDNLPMVLEPFPGKIGGCCAGSFSLFHENPIIQQARVDIQCILRSQKEDNFDQKVLWQESQIAEVTTETYTEKIQFQFYLNPSLKPSQAAETLPFISWEIYLHLTLKDGTSLQRIYGNIPVFKY